MNKTLSLLQILYLKGFFARNSLHLSFLMPSLLVKTSFIFWDLAQIPLSLMAFSLSQADKDLGSPSSPWVQMVYYLLALSCIDTYLHMNGIVWGMLPTVDTFFPPHFPSPLLSPSPKIICIKKQNTYPSMFSFALIQSHNLTKCISLPHTHRW